MPWTIALALFVTLGVAVVLHEATHFAILRLCGAKPQPIGRTKIPTAARILSLSLGLVFDGRVLKPYQIYLNFLVPMVVEGLVWTSSTVIAFHRVFLYGILWAICGVFSIGSDIVLPHSDVWNLRRFRNR